MVSSIIAVIIAIAVFTLTAATGLGYAVHVVTASRAAAPDPRARATLWEYLRSWMWEWWWSLVIAITYPLGWFPKQRTWRYDPAGGPPIVLLHGYALNRSAMLLLRSRLRRGGFRNLYAFNLSPLFGDIDRITRGACVDLRCIAAATQGAPLIVIAFSMGGVVARRCLEQDPSLAVGKIITVGSPHGGTRMASFGIGKNARQLRPQSDFLRGLLPESGTEVVSIYSQLDNFVIPSASANFGPHSRSFQHCGHATLLYDSRVSRAVLEEVEGFGKRGRESFSSRGAG